ncbi:MAG: substrate-binding domain-containing protein [Woeseia sp.]
MSLRTCCIVLATLTAGSPAAQADGQLRVCADPNNLPFSNEQQEGFENAAAEIIADELGAKLSYTWWAQRRGFIRNTLNAGSCDLVIGVPAGYDLVETTRPWYRSTYVFVYRPGTGEPLQSMLDARLRDLTIGVHLTGEDGANPPPAHALGQQGIVDNVVGYMIYGDYRNPNPPARLIEAVASGDIDVAAAWGPTAGFFARRSAPPLELQPITDTGFTTIPFQFSIAMGVRKGKTRLRDRIQDVLDRRQVDLRDILVRFDVPLLPLETLPPNGADQQETSP